MGRISEGADERGTGYWTRAGGETNWRGESAFFGATLRKNSVEEEEEK